MSMFGMTDTLKTLLIQEIYQRPLIWKPSDPRYTDVPARWVAFEEVAKALSNEKVQFSSDMVKMAWKNMTDYYNHIRRRNDRARAAGLTPPQSKWYFFNMLHFIRQEKSPAKRKYNWLEPSKIKSSSLNDAISGDGTNGTVSLDGSDVLPRPIAIRPAPGDSVVDTSHRPRTKQSEKAKLQAKREALRDANLSTSSSVDSNTIKIKKERNLKVIDVVGDNDNDADEDMNEDDDDDDDMNDAIDNDYGSDASNNESVSYSVQNGPKRRSSARVKRQNVAAQVNKSTAEITSDGSVSGTAAISRSGRRIVKRRLSLSPSPIPPQRLNSQSQATTPSRIYPAQSPPNKRMSMSHTAKQSSRYVNHQSSPSSNFTAPLMQRRSYSRAAVTTSSGLPQVYHMTGVSSRPVVALDSTSYFARGIAARLYLIKAESPNEYSNICDRIHEILLEAECALNIDTISG